MKGLMTKVSVECVLTQGRLQDFTACTVTGRSPEPRTREGVWSQTPQK